LGRKIKPLKFKYIKLEFRIYGLAASIEPNLVDIYLRTGQRLDSETLF
jgi:hypothetical protein